MEHDIIYYKNYSNMLARSLNEEKKNNEVLIQENKLLKYKLEILMIKLQALST
jgi:hypothetical protein